MEENKYHMVSKTNIDEFNEDCGLLVDNGFKFYGPPTIITINEGSIIILFTQAFAKGFSSNQLLTTHISSDNIENISREYFDDELFEE